MVSLVLKCSNIDDVADIIQNVYLDVYKRLYKNKEITKTYIIGIAKNKVRDYYRFNYKAKFVSLFSSKEMPLIDSIPSDIDIEKSMSIKYDTQLVWDYLKSKNVIISKIFYLYFKLELTLKEISEELGISISNVKHYLYRTLKELNTYLERIDKND